MKEYYNPDHDIRRRCYLKCVVQKPDESVAEFGRYIREYARRVKMDELEDGLTNDLFLVRLETQG